MKKQLLLAAGTVLALASCQNEAANTADTQTHIDSAVNARVEEISMQLMMQNDSLINAEAQRRADSIILAMKGTPAPPARNTRTNTPAPAPPAATTTPAPRDPQKARNNDAPSVESQKSRNNDASQSTEQQKRRNNQ